MIRINLLGVPKAKRGKRPSTAASTPGEGPSTLLLALVLLLLGASVSWYFYHQAEKNHDDAVNELQREQKENLRLAEVKNKYEASLKQVEQYKQRVKVIDDLKAGQQGPVDMLNLVANTVNETDAVWLEAMTNDGKSIDFTGMALSPNAVAALMRNLQKTGAFRSVEIKETSQDNTVKELQAFKFELICELMQASKTAEKKS